MFNVYCHRLEKKYRWSIPLDHKWLIIIFVPALKHLQLCPIKLRNWISLNSKPHSHFEKAKTCRSMDLQLKGEYVRIMQHAWAWSERIWAVEIVCKNTKQELVVCNAINGNLWTANPYLAYHLTTLWSLANISLYVKGSWHVSTALLFPRNETMKDDRK